MVLKGLIIQLKRDASTTAAVEFTNQNGTNNPAAYATAVTGSTIRDGAAFMALAASGRQQLLAAPDTTPSP